MTETVERLNRDDPRYQELRDRAVQLRATGLSLAGTAARLEAETGLKLTFRQVRRMLLYPGGTPRTDPVSRAVEQAAGQAERCPECGAATQPGLYAPYCGRPHWARAEVDRKRREHKTSSRADSTALDAELARRHVLRRRLAVVGLERAERDQPAPYVPVTGIPGVRGAQHGAAALVPHPHDPRCAGGAVDQGGRPGAAVLAQRACPLQASQGQPQQFVFPGYPVLIPGHA